MIAPRWEDRIARRAPRSHTLLGSRTPAGTLELRFVRHFAVLLHLDDRRRTDDRALIAPVKTLRTPRTPTACRTPALRLRTLDYSYWRLSISEQSTDPRKAEKRTIDGEPSTIAGPGAPLRTHTPETGWRSEGHEHESGDQFSNASDTTEDLVEPVLFAAVGSRSDAPTPTATAREIPLHRQRLAHRKLELTGRRLRRDHEFP